MGEGARLFCPNKKCSQLLIADDKRANTAMECPYCTEQLCANCGVAWHQGMTCQQYQVGRDAAGQRVLLGGASAEQPCGCRIFSPALPWCLKRDSLEPVL